MQGFRSKLLHPRDVLAPHGARHRSPSNLANLAQRKMELNDFCSPDLSNDRRQNDVASYRNLNNDGVGLTPSIGQLFNLKIWWS